MFSQVMVGSDDIVRSKTDAVFEAIGGREAITDPRGG